MHQLGAENEQDHPHTKQDQQRNTTATGCSEMFLFNDVLRDLSAHSRRGREYDVIAGWRFLLGRNSHYLIRAMLKAAIERVVNRPGFVLADPKTVAEVCDQRNVIFTSETSLLQGRHQLKCFVRRHSCTVRPVR